MCFVPIMMVVPAFLGSCGVLGMASEYQRLAMARLETIQANKQRVGCLLQEGARLRNCRQGVMVSWYGLLLLSTVSQRAGTAWGRVAVMSATTALAILSAEILARSLRYRASVN